MKSVTVDPYEKYRLPAGIERSRSSKVQGHALEVFAGGQEIGFFTALDPMLRKVAATVATTIIKHL
eukprot:2650784-Pyramimonas_sp.AAC.1